MHHHIDRIHLATCSHPTNYKGQDQDQPQNHVKKKINLKMLKPRVTLPCHMEMQTSQITDNAIFKYAIFGGYMV
jgi:hypothetical protein